MNKADKYYLQNLKRIRRFGVWDENPRPKWKDGLPAYSKFITQVYEEYDLNKGQFPITTLRNTPVKTAIKEMLWIYSMQSSSLDDAHSLGITWWDDFNIGDGTIGQRYGATVKRYGLMDKLLHDLKHDPFSRRHIIDLYQYSDMQETSGLHPCAFQTLWSCRKYKGDIYLDLTLTQRSNDYIVAGYINKIQYVALQMMVANSLGYKIGKFAHFVQNLHVYNRHIPTLELLIKTSSTNEYPRIYLPVRKTFYEYSVKDFTIEYTPLALLPKLEIAI